MSKPIIGITCTIDFLGVEKSFTSLKYIDAVVHAGGVPVLLTHVERPDLVVRQLEAVDAVLGVGGADHDPSIYGQERHPMTVLLPKRRQQYDLALFHEVWERRIPALMICGSTQGINLARGGTLIQHLEEVECHDGLGEEFAHEIVIERDSRLADLFGSGTAFVNSDHHQAIDEAGAGLRVAARSADGVIEAVEAIDKSHPLLGVQWHPERIPNEQESQFLFNWLIDEALKARPLRLNHGRPARLSPFV